MLRKAYRKAVIALVRPYTRRELPGWGYLYRAFVGSFEKDRLWQGEGERWVRGKLHGYEMSLRIGGWSNRHTFFLERFYDLPTQLLLMKALRPGDIFVDVGANEGMMTLLGARLVGESGRVLSFEPNPKVAAILKRNLRRNAIANVELHEMGLSDAESELELFVPEINTGQGSFAQSDDGDAGSSVTCPVRIGDAVIGERNPRLIKIDVEGFEGHVLKGLRKTIERARPIICVELIAEHQARAGTTPAEIIAWLQSCGYQAFRLGLSRRKALSLEPLGGFERDCDAVFAPEGEILTGG
jgi:FkbM family methyltransferase